MASVTSRSRDLGMICVDRVQGARRARIPGLAEIHRPMAVDWGWKTNLNERLVVLGIICDELEKEE